MFFHQPKFHFDRCHSGGRLAGPKMTSPGGKLTALACHPIKNLNKAEELTYLHKKCSKLGCLNLLALSGWKCETWLQYLRTVKINFFCTIGFSMKLTHLSPGFIHIKCRFIYMVSTMPSKLKWYLN
jgi:hypothetical protein